MHHRVSHDGSPGSPGRRPRRQACLAATLLLLLVALLGTTRLHQQEAVISEDAEEEQYDAVIFVTHPKTGTAAALCVVEALQVYLRRHCQHSVMTSFVNENLTGPATGYYMHLAKSVAFEQFHAVQQPYLMLRTGSAPFETCYDSLERPKDERAIHHQPTHSAQPGRVCAAECPCVGNTTQCLSFGHCYSSEPFARLLWVHVIRHPVDIVLSLYNYHASDPPAEAWLEEVAVTHYASYLADSGVDREVLQKVGAFADDERSYWEFLQNASLADGLQMEFMRSAPGLWKMARLKRRLSALSGRSLHIRFEDLFASPRTAWAPLFEAIQTPCLESNMTGFQDFLLKKCGTERWMTPVNATNATAGNATDTTAAGSRGSGSAQNSTGSSSAAAAVLSAAAASSAGRGLISGGWSESEPGSRGSMEAGGNTEADDGSGGSQTFSGGAKGTISRVNASGTSSAGRPSLSLSPSGSGLAEPPSTPLPPGSGAKRAAQIAALMADPYIRSQVCQLERLLGYSTYQDRCGEDGSWAWEASAAGLKRKATEMVE